MGVGAAIYASSSTQKRRNVINSANHVPQAAMKYVTGLICETLVQYLLFRIPNFAEIHSYSKHATF